MHHNFKRSLSLLLLTVALALPTSTFAASSSSDTSESLTVGATVSLTAPATASFVVDPSTFGPPAYTYDAFVTVISSNNPTGLKVTATVDPLVTAGSINVATSQRHLILTEDSSTGSGAALTKSQAGDTTPFATSSTVVELASATGPLAGRRVGVTYWIAKSDFLVGGDYSGAAHYVATTNP